MRNINKFEKWPGDPKYLRDELINSKNDFSNVKKAKETINRLANELLNNKNNNDMTNKDLTNYKPYSIGRYTKEGYADICFQSEGIMTVPKGSAETIVGLLNDAFKNGVKMTIKNVSLPLTSSVTPSEPIIKSRPMPLEEPHPINSYNRKR